MTDIQFGEKRARADYGLIIAPYAIPQPEPQTNYVDIPGRDGALDLSEAFGAVRYLDREIPLTMYALAPFDASVSAFAGFVHGKRLNLIFDRDPDYFYDARVTITDVEKEGGFCTLNLSCRAKPYKRAIMETTKTETVTNSATVKLTNGRMPVVPTITVSAEMTLAFSLGGTSYQKTLSAGTHMIPSLVLSEGDTDISVTGAGTISFVYRQGAL